MTESYNQGPPDSNLCLVGVSHIPKQQVLHARCRLALDAGRHMAVKFERDRDQAMTKEVLHNFGVCGLLEEQRGGRVTQVMKVNWRRARSMQKDI
jgi:hypothetical protein